MGNYSAEFTFGFVSVTLSTLAFVVVYIVFLKNLMDLLRNVQPDNRQVPPGLVWILMLHFLPAVIDIPFNQGWLGYDYFTIAEIIRKLSSVFLAGFQFYLFVKIADSVTLEYDNRAIYYEHKPAFMAGIWLAIAYAAAFLLSTFGIIYLSLLASGGYLIAFFVYWFQTHQIKKLLGSTSIRIETTDEDSIFKGL